MLRAILSLLARFTPVPTLGCDTFADLSVLPIAADLLLLTLGALTFGIVLCDLLA